MCSELFLFLQRCWKSNANLLCCSINLLTLLLKLIHSNRIVIQIYERICVHRAYLSVFGILLHNDWIRRFLAKVLFWITAADSSRPWTLLYIFFSPPPCFSPPKSFDNILEVDCAKKSIWLHKFYSRRNQINNHKMGPMHAFSYASISPSTFSTDFHPIRIFKFLFSHLVFVFFLAIHVVQFSCRVYTML